MSLIRNIKNIDDDEVNVNENAYTTPAVIRKDKDEISFKKSLLISTLLHPSVVALAWLVVVILMLMGITLSIFDPPKPKVQDIEFVLVDREATPINKNTKFRADKNSRAGGKHDPKRKVSMPSPAPAKKVVAKSSSTVAKAKKQVAQTKTKTKTATKNLGTQAKKTVTKATHSSAPKPSASQAPARPQPPTARPSVRPPSAPKVTTNPSSPFVAPVPPTATTGRMSTGPVGGTSGTARTASGGGGAYSPKPSLSPGYGSGTRSGTRTSSGGGYGNAGNPGPGNPNGRPGIDALKEPDFGPYMRELQRRIKLNWDPPKGNESKRVVLLFKIGRNGQLLSNRVYKSSGLQSADRAALNAVSISAPFRPLPANFRGQSIDIQFTFDYNVFGASGYR